MAPLGQFRGFDDGGCVARPCPDEEDEAPVVRDAFDDFCSTSEVGGGYFEADDVDAGSHPVDVALVHGVPETGCVAEMALGCEQELECYIFGAWR